MGESVDMLRAAEAAIVAGVALRDVNRAVDERILPSGFVGLEGGSRRFSPGACVIMAFYATSSAELTAEWRLQVIKQAAPRLRHTSWRELRAMGRDDWSVRHDFLTVDLAPFVTGSADRHEQLGAAVEMVTRSPDVLGGMPVIRGTRIPVRDVAASVAAGHPRERILEAYPSLSGDQIHLAVLYAQANPTRGRPRTSLAVPAGAKVAEMKVSRRQKSG